MTSAAEHGIATTAPSTTPPLPRSPSTRTGVRAGRAPLSAAAALRDVAIGVSSTTDLDRVLERVVRVTLDALPAERATILLLDNAGGLSPSVSVARRDDVEAWTRFQEMPPITVASVEIDQLFQQDRAVAVEDAGQSALVPPEWRAAFGLESLAIAPMLVGQTPCGALVVDYPRDRLFDAGQLQLLEGIAAATAAAVRNARDYREALTRSEALERAMQVASVCNAAATTHEVLEAAMRGMAEACAAVSCSLNVLDADHAGFTTLAAFGSGQPVPGNHAISDYPDSYREALQSRWARDADEVVVIPADGLAVPSLLPPSEPVVARALAVPFGERRRVHGFALLGLPGGHTVTPLERRVVSAVGGQVWLAVERARLADRSAQRPRYTETLHRVAAAVALSPDIAAVVEQLVPVVRELAGAELIDVLISDRRAARLFSAGIPRGEMATQVRRWRHQAHRTPVEVGGLLAVPLMLDGGVVGALRARVLPDRPPEDAAECLTTLASTLAELVSRTSLQARIVESERDLAVAQERQRIAQELHEGVGRLLIMAGTSLEQSIAATTEPAQRARLQRTSGLISQAVGRVRSAGQAIDLLTQTSSGLPEALRRLVRDLTASGPSAHLRVEGQPHPLPADTETVLLRAAVMALGTLQRPGHSRTVWTVLRYGADGVVLDVIDDGIALSLRAEQDSRVHTALGLLRQRLTAVGGSCVVQPYTHVGLQFVCSVPATRPPPSPLTDSVVVSPPSPVRRSS